ncbi:glutamate receptor ionotropic, kainate 2-like isoform X2 [Periplaneta americana]|uniref:glutamate receptor ionotropic, kainate 2-like isoform X2 n=1 Tax=Periplaneta americana TaxID=6978 RepID=UPI0037E7D222
MAGSLLLLLLAFSLPAAPALPPRLPLAVLFHPEDYPLQHIAVKYALQHINVDPELLPGTELYRVDLNVSQSDSFAVGKRVCGLASEGIAAVFGPRTPDTTGIVESICETLEIPHMEIYPTSPRFPARCLINLHPAEESISKAIVDVVTNFLHWRTFTVLYETEAGLIRLQDVLKAHGPNDPPITVRQFLPGSDQRQLLKDINASKQYHILLECEADHVIEVLRQAREIGMMGDYHSYFITSLDTHTLDFSEFEDGHTNITLLRLVDPDDGVVKNVVKFWTDWEQHYKRPFSVTPQTVRLEMALMHDAVFLYARALHQLYLHGERFGVQGLRCDGDGRWPHGFPLVNFMKLMAMDGMTGNIRFDEFGRRSRFKLDVLELFLAEFKKVGEWATETGVVRTQTETEKEAEIQKSLQFKTFIVSSRTGEPFLVTRKKKDDKEVFYGNDRYVGYSMDLLKKIAEVIPDFKFEFRLVPNNKHAELVADLQARRADLAICDLTITHQREQMIDFTMPFMNLGIGILFSKPIKPEPRLFAFLDPFSIDVWIYVATAYLGVSILLFVLARMSPAEWTSPHPCKAEAAGGVLETRLTMSNCIWHNCGSIMQQGSDIAPQAVSTRMVAGMWWFFTLIMISSYTANLAAFLTLNRMDSSISSAEDLAKQYKIKYGTMEGGSTAAFFQNSNDSTYKRMWTVMSQTRPSVFVRNNKEGKERVQKAKGLYAYFMESTAIEYEVERNCDLQQVGGLLDSKGYGIGLPLNSPYRTMVSGAVLKLQERGILEELKLRWWKVQDGLSCSALEAESAKADSNELGMDNVGGVFVVLIAGTLAAFLMSILELLWNCRKIAVEEKISPCEALTSELKFAVNCANANKPVRKREEEEDEEDEEVDTMPAGVTAGSFARLGFDKFKEKD